MEIYVVVNNKGGVGKTETAELIAEYFALVEKKKTLLCDFDESCSLSTKYLKMEFDLEADLKKGGYYDLNNEDDDESPPQRPPHHPDYNPEDLDENTLDIVENSTGNRRKVIWDGRSSIADIFYGRPVIPYPTAIENLDIAPGYSSLLNNIVLATKTEIKEKIYTRIQEFFSGEDIKEAYDVIVLDTPPTKNPLAKAAIRVATQAVIPCPMEDKCINGITKIIQLLGTESSRRSSDNPINIIGIIATLFDPRYSIHKSHYENLLSHPSAGKYMMPNKICKRVQYLEIHSIDSPVKSIFQLGNNKRDLIVKKEALQFCKEVKKRSTIRNTLYG